MNLPFSTEINGMPNFFVIKIWRSLIMNNLVEFQTLNEYKRLHIEKFGKSWATDQWPGKPKIHTIRKIDFRWLHFEEPMRHKQGDKIHFVINNRQKNRFKFAPVIPVKNNQIITFDYDSLGEKSPYPIIKIFNLTEDGHWGELSKELQPINHFEYITQLQELAENDGFERWQDFLDYWNEDGFYKIIHWTDKMY